MNASMISWSIATFLLAAGAATAYHIAPPADANAPTDIATTWTPLFGLGLLLNTCESTGPFDIVNPQPVPLAGGSGLCYATSQAVLDRAAKKETLAESHANGDPIWSSVEPTCLDGDCSAWSLLTGDTDWFARVGSNAHSCFGTWDDRFLYRESLAYYFGTGPTFPSYTSGHVTFFINDGLLSGSYDGQNDVDETALDETLTAGFCSGSPLVGLAAGKV